MITLILSLVGGPGLARVIRGRFMAIKNEDFVVAALSMGLANSELSCAIWRPVFPATSSRP